MEGRLRGFSHRIKGFKGSGIALDDNPTGLIFFKDYTKITAGTYAGTTHGKLLNADYSIGSPQATFTSTDGNFTIGANGYSATTANADVLKYAILNNRTAAEETIVIKFMPNSDFANDGVRRQIIQTDTKNRVLAKSIASANVNFQPNATDNGTIIAGALLTIQQNIFYIFSCISIHNTNPQPTALLYLNNSLVSSDTTHGDFTNPNWGNNFYIGSNSTGGEQLNGSIAWVKIFNRALTASEIATLQ